MDLRLLAHSNAYFYGFFKNKRIVIFDTLINQLDTQGIISVLGHELGHWKMNHTIKHIILSEVFMFVFFLLFGQMVNNDDMYQSFGFTSSHNVFIGLLLLFLDI